jgi:hypothetical protein
MWCRSWILKTISKILKSSDMVYNAQDHWVSKLYQLSGILKARKQDVSKIGSFWETQESKWFPALN